MSDATNQPEMTPNAGASPELSSDASIDVTIVGARRIFYFNDAGQPAYQVYDLTASDYLNPQPGDEFFHGEVHDHAVRVLASMLHHHYRYSPTASVHLRPKIVWRDGTLAQPMPDVAVVNNLSESQRHRPILDLAAEQHAAGVEVEVNLRALFEVTSPRLAVHDHDAKRALYARAGVPEYWIIDCGQRVENDSPRFTIHGFQLQNGSYTTIEPVSSGAGMRWQSKACRLWLALTPDGQGFQLGDVRTGKALPMPADDDDPSISAQADANRRAQSIAGQLKL